MSGHGWQWPSHSRVTCGLASYMASNEMVCYNREKGGGTMSLGGLAPAFEGCEASDVLRPNTVIRRVLLCGSRNSRRVKCCFSGQQFWKWSSGNGGICAVYVKFSSTLAWWCGQQCRMRCVEEWWPCRGIHSYDRLPTMFSNQDTASRQDQPRGGSSQVVVC